MDKIRTFTIELRNPQGVYYPRQVVRGEVILELDAPAKVRGESFLCWTKYFFFFSVLKIDASIVHITLKFSLKITTFLKKKTVKANVI